MFFIFILIIYTLKLGNFYPEKLSAAVFFLLKGNFLQIKNSQIKNRKRSFGLYF